jgi:hypothetical protein
MLSRVSQRGFATKVYKNYINGKWVDSKATQFID